MCKISKEKISDLIVVEGKSDIDFLSSFLDADFYKVNGSAINEKDIKYLKEVIKKRDIIVLTDPDYPGLQIRNKINKEIPEVKNAYVRKEVSIKHHKVGVAESTKEEVLNSLKNIKSNENHKKGNLSVNDLYDLGLSGIESSKELRKLVCERFNIGFNNTKRMLEKINLLNISKSEIEEIIKDVNSKRNHRFL